MALETLKGLVRIGAVDIIDAENVGDDPNGYYLNALSQGKNPFIFIDHEENTISFKIQNGPIKEVGLNGCQVNSLIEAALQIVTGLNNKFPCDENTQAIIKMKETLMWFDQRTKNRVQAGVEGTSQNH